MLNYAIVGIICAAIFGVVCIHTYRNRKSLDEMHGMMAGMMLGMFAGLVTATLFLIPTGNFLWGVIIGSVVGLVVGVPFGKFGGHLGIMEGIMAGPMGGMMGAMLGQMIRPFNIEIFMPFFVAIVLLTLGGIIYMVDCCCKRKISQEKVYSAVAVCVIVLFISVALSFSIETGKETAVPSIKLPEYLRTVDEKTQAVMKDGYQEASVEITGSKYSPNVIAAKKGIPLRIHFHAQKTAGCAREVVFPSLNIDKIIPSEGNETIEINLEKEGVINFRCSMDMVHGRVEVS